MSELKIGDVVELKSGGPEMTVGKVAGETCVAIWFDENNELCEVGFPTAALVKCDRPNIAGIQIEPISVAIANLNLSGHHVASA